MLRFAVDGITSFSEIPLRFATYLGFITSTLAFVYAIVVLGLQFAHMNFPGYTSTMVAILFLGGIQLIGIGILGEYVGRIYDQVKARPLYLIAEIQSSTARMDEGAVVSASRSFAGKAENVTAPQRLTR